MNVVLEATVITVTFNGQVLALYSYNSPLADGRRGVFGSAGVPLDRLRIRTDDAAYEGEAEPRQAVLISDATVTEGTGARRSSRSP